MAGEGDETAVRGERGVHLDAHHFLDRARHVVTGEEALDLRCTHQGVTVGKDGAGWECPAHGSRFAGNGTVTGGPAQRSLATVPSTFANGRLTVG